MEYSKEDLMEAKKQIWGVGENMGQSSIAALKTILDMVIMFGNCFFVRIHPLMLDFIDRIGYNYSRKR